MPLNFPFFTSYPFQNRYYNKNFSNNTTSIGHIPNESNNFRNFSNKSDKFKNKSNNSDDFRNFSNESGGSGNWPNNSNKFESVQKKDPENDNSHESFSEPFFEIFGLQLYLDDILIISILFFLYFEDVHDDALFICLILLLLN